MVQLCFIFSDSEEEVVCNSFTCPGKTPDTGVEPPEWLGELGRDLQEASRAACFLAAMIFWAAVEQKNNHTHNLHISTSSAAVCSTFWSSFDRDTYHRWRPGSHWGRTWHRFHSKCSAAHLSTAVWPWHHQLLWGWCCWSYLENKQTANTARAHLCKHLNEHTHRLWVSHPECQLLRKVSQRQAGGLQAGGIFCKLPGNWPHFPDWRPG